MIEAEGLQKSREGKSKWEEEGHMYPIKKHGHKPSAKFYNLTLEDMQRFTLSMVDVAVAALTTSSVLPADSKSLQRI